MLRKGTFSINSKLCVSEAPKCDSEAPKLIVTVKHLS